MRTALLVAMVGGSLFAQDILPGFKNVKEGEVFVLSEATKMGGTTATEMVIEFHIDKVDATARTLTCTRTATTKLPNMDPIKNTMPPETIPMTAPTEVAPPPPGPVPDAPKTDTVEVTVKGVDGKDVTLKCTHSKTEMSGATSEFWYSVDRVEVDVKSGSGAIKVHALYTRMVADVPSTAGGTPSHTVQETWTATEDLPNFASILSSHTTVEGTPNPIDTSVRLIEVRMP